MKKKVTASLPFLIMPVFIPIYTVLDQLFLVDIFGCGCVPSVQTNMLNIPYNANDLRLTVFGLLAVGMSVWSIILAKNFEKKIAKLLYCAAVVLMNVALALWVIKTFLWK